MTLIQKWWIGCTALCMAASMAARAEIAPMPEGSNDRMGVATHFTRWKQDGAIPLIRQMGVSWIRDGEYWAGVEKNRGEYKIPENTWAWLKACKANGIKVIFILNGANPRYENRYDPEAYTRWAAWMAAELKDYVDAFEILNEPNNFGFSKHYGGEWNGNNNSAWLPKYVDLINRAAPAIKAVNPNVKVIGLGAPAPANFRMLAMGISPDVDGVVDHPYSMRLVPELVPWAAGLIKRDGVATADERGSFASQMRMYQQQSAKFNGPKEMWLTEWGFPDFVPLKPGIFAGYTQSAQAKYAQRRFVECLGLNVRVSIWYDFINDGNNRYDAEDNFGVVDSKLKPKPIYHAIQKVARYMAPWNAATWGEINVFPSADRPDRWPIVWDGARLAAPGAIMSYQFTDAAGRRAAAIWSGERADGDLSPRVADVELVSARPIAKVEQLNLMTGDLTPVKIVDKNGRVMIENMIVPDSPVLLILTDGASSAAVRPAETETYPVAGRKWSVNLGSEFPGAKASFRTEAEGPRTLGKIDYDFTGGGQYVAASTSIAIPEGVKELRIPVKSSEAFSVLIRITDATNQVHQETLAYSQAGLWQQIRVDLKRRAETTFGGANDGKKHFPLKEMTIGVGKSHPSGNMLFGDMTALR